MNNNVFYKISIHQAYNIKAYKWRVSIMFMLLNVFFLLILKGCGGTPIEITFREQIRHFLETRLFVDSTANKDFNLGNTNSDQGFIYILGGSHKSLRLKFQVAADLYDKDRADTIMILNSTRMTEFDKELDRNLTDNEWSVKQLTSLGVEAEHIEFIDIEPGFFGTLSEARTLANLAEIKEIQNLYLVNSSYHSRRVLVTFSALFRDSGVDIKIHGADKWIKIPGLFIEYGKVILYEYALIPYNLWKQSG